jgi:hypothetical protein
MLWFLAFMIGMVVDVVLTFVLNALLYGVPLAAAVFAVHRTRIRRLGRSLRSSERIALGAVPILFLLWQAQVYGFVKEARVRGSANKPSQDMEPLRLPDGLRLVVVSDDFVAGGNGECTTLCRRLLLSGKTERIVLEVTHPDRPPKRLAFRRGTADDCRRAKADHQDRVQFNDAESDVARSATLALLGVCVTKAVVDPLPATTLFLNRASAERPEGFYEMSGAHVLHLQAVATSGEVKVLAHAERFYSTPIRFPVHIAVSERGTEGIERSNIRFARHGSIWYGPLLDDVLAAWGLGDPVLQLRLPSVADACRIVGEALGSGDSLRRSAAVDLMDYYLPQHHFLEQLDGLKAESGSDLAYDVSRYRSRVMSFKAGCDDTPQLPVAACSSASAPHRQIVEALLQRRQECNRCRCGRNTCEPETTTISARRKKIRTRFNSADDNAALGTDPASTRLPAGTTR